jgi:proteic killer suppression protein
MIVSFKSKETERIWNQEFSKRFPPGIQSVMLRKLIMLSKSVSFEDLRCPPSNRLEKLKVDREGQYSIRINDQYRICFRWQSGNAVDVEIVDYH